MTGTVLRALLSHWRRNPLQLFAFIAGLALATALWSGVQAINAEARASYDAAANTLGEGQYDQIVPREGDVLTLDTYVALRRAGWQVTPVMEGPFSRDVRLIGIEPLTSPAGLSGTGLLMERVAEARGGAGLLFANAETAALLGDIAAEVVRDENIAPGIAVGDIVDVERLLGTTGFARLLVLPEQPRSLLPLADVATEAQRVASNQQADIGQLTDSFHLNLTAFGLLSFVVGLFIVHATIGLAFEQRRGMIRTLRALGVPLPRLVGLISVEMLGLAVIGAGLGIVLGYLIAALLLPDVAASLRGLYGARISGALALRPEWWLSGLALALGGTVLALATRLVQIARMPLLASVRPRAWAMVSTARLRVQMWFALALIGLSALLGALADGLLAGFALLGCLLLGAALLFPVVADYAIRRIQARTGTPFWAWFWADTRQQLPGLSLALMALLLAVSANIGVATMVSSFRLTFIGFLDQRLAPELFVQTETAEQGAALERYIAARGNELLPVKSTDRVIEGQQAALYGIRVGQTYRTNWSFLAEAPGAWDAVEAGEAAVVNEQFARRGGFWVGDSIGVTPDLTLPIAAVVGDYGNPQGQVVLAAPLYDTIYPGTQAQNFGIRSDAPADLRADIVADLGISNNAMIDQAAIKSVSMEVFERTFLVTGALNVLTLAVAGFAILMSLLTLADLRIPQLAPVWALGQTRRRLGTLELIRAVALAGLVFLCALPVGLALAWVLLSIVNVVAFGWKLPMFLFPGEYGLLGVYAVLAAGLAALWPVARLMRTPPSLLLKVFSNAT